MTRGRVTFIGRDCRADVLELGEIIVTLQHVIDNFDSILRDFALSLEDLNELFLIENKIVELSLQHISYHIDIYIDRDFVDEDEHEITFTNDY